MFTLVCVRGAWTQAFAVAMLYLVTGMAVGVCTVRGLLSWPAAMLSRRVADWAGCDWKAVSLDDGHGGSPISVAHLGYVELPTSSLCARLVETEKGKAVQLRSRDTRRGETIVLTPEALDLLRKMFHQGGEP